jgi:hypothetical protein
MWQGTDYNERLLNKVRNGLVDVYLWGVKGVSPDRGAPHKMVPAAEADAIINMARFNYAKLVDQKPPRSVKAWHERKLNELDGLIDKAVAVRDGKTSQKMTEAGYAAYRKSLGLH